jgi:hypothetical protein
MSFLTNAATETLSFLVRGSNGSEVNLPLTVFLAGVNTPSQVPEPATLSLLAIAFVGFGASRFRRQAKRAEGV